MEIMKIWVTQKSLRRAEQIPAMIKTLEDGYLPKIILNLVEDNSIMVQDGHHRLAAYWLSGRTHLEKHEYLLIEQNQWRPKRGRITDLIGTMPYVAFEHWQAPLAVTQAPSGLVGSTPTRYTYGKRQTKAPETSARRRCASVVQQILLRLRRCRSCNGFVPRGLGVVRAV